MEFPFGHHHHHRDDDEDNDRRRRNHAGFHPPPGVHHISHERSYEPPPPGVHHISHERSYEPPPTYGDPPSGVHHISHERSYEPPPTYPGGSFHHVSHDRGHEFPPPFFGNPVHHVSHDSGPGNAPPLPFLGAAVVPPPPQPFNEAPVLHVAHESQHGDGGRGHGWDEERHHHRPGYTETVNHESREGGAMNQHRTVRIFTKAEENYSLSISDGKVILARKDPSDDRQHWIKDLKYSTKIKDQEGFPAFSLVNKATGEALKHSFGATHPVRLTPYNPNYPDESVLWTESKDLGDGFRCIRMVNNIRLNFDAFHGDESHGGVHDGTILVLWEWLKGKNQRWKIVPY